MELENQLVVFSLDDQRFALGIHSVDRIVRAAEVTPLPDAPDLVHGVINIEGRIVPVVNARKRMGLPERDTEPEDFFIVVRENERYLALVADDVTPVMELAESELVAREKVLPGFGCVQGVAKDSEGIIMVLLPEKTLSKEDHDQLEVAMEVMLEAQNDW
jgi:purine-binding chemotaxis protein CheW